MNYDLYRWIKASNKSGQQKKRQSTGMVINQSSAKLQVRVQKTIEAIKFLASNYIRGQNVKTIPTLGDYSKMLKLFHQGLQLRLFQSLLLLLLLFSVRVSMIPSQQITLMIVIEKYFRNNNWSYPSEVNLHDVARIPALFNRSWTEECIFESHSHCWTECLNLRIDLKEDKSTSKAFRHASSFRLLTSDIAWSTDWSKNQHHKVASLWLME